MGKRGGRGRCERAVGETAGKGGFGVGRRLDKKGGFEGEIVLEGEEGKEGLPDDIGEEG